jgi:hypothetical protein
MDLWVKAFDFINIELSGVPRYVNGVDAKDVVEYLEKHGFKQDSPIEDCNDVMFIHKRML